MSMQSQLQNRTILHGDVLEKIKEIPDESIDCIIDSPPYWGLRDYGIEGQWGLEPDFRDYLKKLRLLMKELHRVLKSTGSCWINLGDTYSGSGKGAGSDLETTKEVWRFDEKPNLLDLVESKSRYGIPERFYIQCIDDGWIARNHIPWIKPNAMPSSVDDRFSNKWESVFFFVKQQKYYFNLNAVREKPKTITKPFNVRVRDGPKGKYGSLASWTKLEEETHNKKGELKQDYVLGADGKAKSDYKGFNERWRNNPKHYEQYMERIQEMRDSGSPHDNPLGNPNGKNPGDVFYDKSKPYAVVERFGTVYYRFLPDHNDLRKYLKTFREKSGITIEEIESHFNNQAGHHWFEKNGSYPSVEDYQELKKILNLDEQYDNQMLIEYSKPAEKQDNPNGKNPGDVFIINTKPYLEAHFATFPIELPLKILKASCPTKGMVLDPFFGSGSVGVAAEMLDIKWMGIELKEEYIQIARKRLEPFMMERLI